MDGLSSSFVSSIATYYTYYTSSKNSALLIIRHPLPNDWKSPLIIQQRSSRVHTIYGNRMRAQMEYWTLSEIIIFMLNF